MKDIVNLDEIEDLGMAFGVKAKKHMDVALYEQKVDELLGDFLKLHLYLLDVITPFNYLAKIYFDLDHDLIEYDKMLEKDYIFSDDVDYHKELWAVINSKIDWYGIYYFSILDVYENELKTLMKKKGMSDPFSGHYNNKSVIDTIIKAFERGDEETKEFMQNLAEMGLEDGSIGINDMRIERFNNNAKCFNVYGGLRGDAMTISDIDSQPVAMISGLSIPLSIEDNYFYLQLLGESYLLYCDGHYKLSAFLAFTALENFINHTLYSKDDKVGELANEEKIPLMEKSEKLFKDYAEGYLDNRLYKASLDIFNKYEEYRNDVAHGKGQKTYNEEVAKNMFKAVLYQILAINLETDSFAELYRVMVKQRQSYSSSYPLFHRR